MPSKTDSYTPPTVKQEDMGAYRKEFLAEVSHELKTSVFLLQGYLDALNKTKKGLKKVQRRLLKRARTHAGLLAKLVEDILTTSLMESGTIGMHISPFCMRVLCEHLMEDFQKMADENHIHLCFEAPSGTQTVQADRAYMEQAMRNLIHNAIRYNQPEGQITVSLTPQETSLVVRISDTGKGIASSDLKHIFDLFYRIEKSRNRETGGSGIGLSLVKHILEAHNQQIHVQSTLNEGTTFHFSLPRNG